VSEPDGTESGPGEARTRQSGRPPVPTAVPSEQHAADGQHRTERVPFPLPPRHDGEQPRPAAPRTEQLPAQPAGGAPDGQPPAAPVTGQLRLGGYPPRVPGAARTRPAPPAAEDDDDR